MLVAPALSILFLLLGALGVLEEALAVGLALWNGVVQLKGNSTAARARLAASRLDSAAAVVCGRGARVNACAQAPPDYRSTVMLCWWSRAGGWRCGSSRDTSQPRADYNENRGGRRRLPSREASNSIGTPRLPVQDQIPSEPLVTQVIGISAGRLLLCDYIVSLLDTISSTLTMGSAFALSISSISVR